MKTLDHWTHWLSRIPSTIQCQAMKIVAKDHEPPVFVGPGHIDINAVNKISFRMFASAPDITHAISSIMRASQNRYETLDQFRLFATDYEGYEWACGWIRPAFEADNGVAWLITGSLKHLTAYVSSSWVTPEKSVELLFQPAPDVPLTQSMLTITSIGGEEVNRSWHTTKHSLTALDTTITFFQEPSEDALWVTAQTSQMLTHPHAENWLGEPLRILLGQLTYPRLVARNFGDGSAFIEIRSSPVRLGHTGWVSLMATILPMEQDRFWNLYQDLLTMIAATKDSSGHPNFESNPVTRFYEELIQATQGSRWVQSMTLASSAEGLAKLLMTPADRAPEYPEKDVRSLRRMIEEWEGCPSLRKRVLSSFAWYGEKSVQAFLKNLQQNGQILPDQMDSWKAVRNAVMHGNLTSPWSTEESDRKMKFLVGLVHTLTQLLLKQTAPSRE